MIIFYKQKKSIKAEDNFQRRKASTTKTFETTTVYQRRPQQINKVQSHLEQNSDQTFNCKMNPHNMDTTLITQI
jgi:hypothetical protein